MIRGGCGFQVQSRQPRQHEGLSRGATRAKKENGLVPASLGPQEDRQTCPKQGRHSLGFGPHGSCYSQCGPTGY